MQIQQIRNATLKLTYAGKVLLTDPYLADKHSLVSYKGTVKSPLVDLPCPVGDVVDGVDMVLISHIHSDHFDKAAQRVLSKDLPLFCQPGDEPEIEASGFHHLITIHESVTWKQITIIRTPGQHGTGDVLKDMGHVSGFVLQAEGEPTVYWTGDTVLYDAVLQVIKTVKPDIILTHSCGAVWGDDVPILMDAEQTVSLCRAAPDAIVIATHMEAVDHATVSRTDLRVYAKKEGISSLQLRIPEDGDVLKF